MRKFLQYMYKMCKVSANFWDINSQNQFSVHFYIANLNPNVLVEENAVLSRLLDLIKLAL
jgi:hypothetical protein